MRLVLFILVTLFIATMLTLAAIENPGYVLIARARGKTPSDPWEFRSPANPSMSGKGNLAS